MSLLADHDGRRGSSVANTMVRGQQGKAARLRSLTWWRTSSAWLCVAPLEDPERDGEQGGGEDYEDACLDALERPEPAGWLVGHVPPVTVRHQAGQGVGFEA